MADSYNVVEQIFNAIGQTLTQIAGCATGHLKAALKENLGTLILWDCFQISEISIILESSLEITLTFLHILHRIAGCILKLSRLTSTNSTSIEALVRTREVTRRYLRSQESIQKAHNDKKEDSSEHEHEHEHEHECENDNENENENEHVDETQDVLLSDNSDDDSEDDSEDEEEAVVDTMRLYIKHLMRLTPTMERILADAMSGQGYGSSLNTTVDNTTPLLQQESVSRPRVPLSTEVSPTPLSSNEQPRPSSQPAKASIESSPPPYTQTADGPANIGTSKAMEVAAGVIVPRPPGNPGELKFYSLMSTLAETPLQYENPNLLDQALSLVPIDSIYTEAEEEFNIMEALAESMGEGHKPEWGYQDIVIRSLLRWFKRQFFEFVNCPSCSRCNSRTFANGMVRPTDDEMVRGAARVEFFRCPICGGTERFPRYKDVWTLLETRKGRAGEFVNCFTMLCRAAGCRARWVWCPEDGVWTEIYSEHRREWIHVDPPEELWNQPTVYTEGWGRKYSYCIAFSAEGATDVTHRYVRDANSQAPRNRVSESVLKWIIIKLRQKQRESLPKEQQSRLMREDEREERELRGYVVRAGLAAMMQQPLRSESATQGTATMLRKVDPTALSESFAAEQQSQ